MALDLEDVKEKLEDVNKRIDKQDMRIESIEKHQTEIIINQAKFEAVVNTRFDGIEKLIKDDSIKKREHEEKLLDHLIEQSKCNNKSNNKLLGEYPKFIIKLALTSATIGTTAVIAINNLN